MAISFNVNISTRDASIYEGRVVSLVAPGEMGYLGVLANHAPLITTLVPGKIVLRNESGAKTIFRSKGNGFLDVVKNNVTILLDSAEPL